MRGCSVVAAPVRQTHRERRRLSSLLAHARTNKLSNRPATTSAKSRHYPPGSQATHAQDSPSLARNPPRRTNPSALGQRLRNRSASRRLSSRHNPNYRRTPPRFLAALRERRRSTASTPCRPGNRRRRRGPPPALLPRRRRLRPSCLSRNTKHRSHRHAPIPETPPKDIHRSATINLNPTSHASAPACATNSTHS